MLKRKKSNMADQDEQIQKIKELEKKAMLKQQERIMKQQKNISFESPKGSNSSRFDGIISKRDSKASFG